MTVKEADRLSVMKQIDKGSINLREATVELGISLRQMKRIRRRYLIEGIDGLLSKHRGKISPNRIDGSIKKKILEIINREEYRGFGPLFLNEKLKEKHGFYVSNETLRKWMIEEKLWIAGKKKKRRIHQRRAPRERFGELLQGDASIHHWFEDRGGKCALVIFVDDATSQLTAGRFVPAETTIAYQTILEEHLKKYGRPCSIYVDKHAIFCTSRENSHAREGETHFGRVLRELDIELICAHSPQAKGRVERANGTLQDRLIKEMRLRKISTIEEANLYLPEFIEEYNRRFKRPPKSSNDAHRNMREKDNLEMIFARRAKRKLSKNLSFSYEGTSYQLLPEAPHRLRGTHVEIFQRPNQPLLVMQDGKILEHSELSYLSYRKPETLNSKELEVKNYEKKKWKPSRNHPWR